MQQLSSQDKQSQMSKKYKNLNVNKIISLSKNKNDLGGWRNKLVDVSSVLNPNFVLDMGGGNGQQLIRLKSKYKKLFLAWIVDFSDQPKEITNFLKLNNFKYEKKNVFRFLKKKKLPKFDMIYMFGFLHEIKNVEKLFNELKKKITPKTNIIISDNDLYRSAHELSEILNKTNINFTTYYSISFFNFFHVFKKIFGKGKKNIYCFHRGRVDKILSIIGSLNKRNKLINLI